MADRAGRRAVRRGARRGLPARRSRGVERARRAVRPLRLGDRDPGVPPVRARRRGRLPGRLHAVYERLGLAPLRRRDPAVGRAADAQLLPRPAARLRPRRAGRGGRGAGRRRRDREARRGDDRARGPRAARRASARRSSTASSAATRATGRSATRSTSPPERSRAGSPAASGTSGPSSKAKEETAPLPVV